MNDEVIPLLKVHEYFQGASDETLEEVVRLGRVAQYPAGSVVHEADVVLTTVGFVLRGRLKAVRISPSGDESLFRMIERGEQFGLMVGALGESGADPRRRAGAHDDPQAGLRRGDRADIRQAGPAPSVAEDLRGEPAKVLPRRRSQAVGDDAGADSRFTRHAPGGRTAHPATVRRR